MLLFVSIAHLGGAEIFITFLCILSAWLTWETLALRRINRYLRTQIHQEVQNSSSFYKINQEKKHIISLLVHELRSPLALTRFNTENLLFSGKNLTREHIADLNEIEGALANMEELIHHILQIQNQEEPMNDALELDLAAVVKSSVSEYENLANEKKVHIDCRIAPETAFKSVGNPYLLKQVVNNLLSNAVKFSPSEQTVTVSLQRSENTCEIRVKDMGEGLGPAEQALAFQKYYHKNKASDHGEEGAGLGLYLVKWFVERLQGAIKIESRPGAGAEFIVSLPACQAQ